MMPRERDEQELLRLCDQVRECAFSLHRFLRHGHPEKVYENGMVNRLRRTGIQVRQQEPLQVCDDDGVLLGEFSADLFIEQLLIVELKACSSLVEEHSAQLFGYLRASSIRDGLLINFGSPRLQVRKLVL